MAAKRVFIVRPFGVKDGVDFDRVEALLIQPAIRGVSGAGLEGGTTVPIVEQGNIREDMFRELVTADLVIADLSIHNANVFYELGIRHGLRPHATFLLRAGVSQFPFDLQTDRYLKYDAAHPEASLPQLIAALDATLASARVDSPVYQLLPGLRAPDPDVLNVAPREFADTVDVLRAAGHRGDLRLLAHEARQFSWASQGLRLVGRAQFAIDAWSGASETFEWLREIRPGDIEANQRLGTLYRRLAEDASHPDDYLARSSAAIQLVIDSPAASRWDVAEAWALKGRNIKAQWFSRLRGRPAADARRDGLAMPELEAALETYATGFAHNLNHFYSGLNALLLLRIRCDLATLVPDTWAGLFASDADAARTLEDMETRFQRLAGSVQLAIEASRLELARQPRPDPEVVRWTEISAADHTFVTASRPATVVHQYRKALTGASVFAIRSVREQLRVFQTLDLRSTFLSGALAVVDQFAGPEAARAPRLDRVVLFTGHMVDAPNRPRPRFPPTPEAEAEARRMIEEAVGRECALTSGSVVGVASGACGGDILFHEVCAERGIPTHMFLALPRDVFITTSVQHAGPRWVDRFNRLCERLAPRTLAQTPELPAWLTGLSDYSLWQRNNLWVLFNALALNPRDLTLVALWDGADADGPGGTDDLVRQVRARGKKVELLPADRLKHLRSPAQ